MNKLLSIVVLGVAFSSQSILAAEVKVEYSNLISRYIKSLEKIENKSLVTKCTSDQGELKCTWRANNSFLLNIGKFDMGLYTEGFIKHMYKKKFHKELDKDIVVKLSALKILKTRISPFRAVKTASTSRKGSSPALMGTAGVKMSVSILNDDGQVDESFKVKGIWNDLNTEEFKKYDIAINAMKYKSSVIPSILAGSFKVVEAMKE